jgi:hypothetical protein
MKSYESCRKVRNSRAKIWPHGSAHGSVARVSKRVNVESGA